MFLFMLMVNIVVRIFISLYIIFLVNNLVVCSCLIVEFWEFFIFIWFIYKREINGICLFLVGLGLFGLVNFSMEGVGYYLLKYIGWWKLYFLIKVLIFFLCFFLVDLQFWYSFVFCLKIFFILLGWQWKNLLFLKFSIQSLLVFFFWVALYLLLGLINEEQWFIWLIFCRRQMVLMMLKW